jgi:hypothetical protein
MYLRASFSISSLIVALTKIVLMRSARRLS